MFTKPTEIVRALQECPESNAFLLSLSLVVAPDRLSGLEGEEMMMTTMGLVF